MIKYFKKALFLVVLIGFSSANAGSYEDFFEAIGRNDARVVQQLLLRGFDPNSVAPDGQSGLMLALRQQSVQVAELLIAHPAIRIEARNLQDESPLMLAALKGQIGICKALIARDADVNKPGWAPLHYAATGGHAEVVQLLLDHHAYIDAESPNNSTPLMMAAMYGNAASVKVLLEAGADPTLRNMHQLSALDFAMQGKRPDAAALITEAMRALGAKTAP